MINTISMQEIRYLNLFEKIIGVRTRFCFKYNQTIFFSVPKNLLYKSIGENGRNIKKMSKILGKKVRIIAFPRDIFDAENFIRSITNPIKFKNFEIKEDKIVIYGGSNKAILIGRNKRRLLEMQKIVKDFFGKEFEIV
ncbi:MAG: hypothetical protein QXX55_01590 [Candidatus Pacearchaeota archaeon]